jgi:hypothetical protein
MMPNRMKNLFAVAEVTLMSPVQISPAVVRSVSSVFHASGLSVRQGAVC